MAPSRQPGDLLGGGRVDLQDDVGRPRLVRRADAAPAAAYASSGKLLGRARPRLDDDLVAERQQLVTVAGVAATRVSRGLVSRGTPMRNRSLPFLAGEASSPARGGCVRRSCT